MGPAGEASLRAALAGRAEKERFETTADAMPDFTASDEAVLGGEWSWFMEVVGPATARGPAPLIDDDLALVAMARRPGRLRRADAAPARCRRPDRPRGHSEWLAGLCPHADPRVVPGHGHLSVLEHGVSALEWLDDVSR